MEAAAADRRSAATAVAAVALAAAIWGLSSIYYKALSHVPPVELLAHRSLWSLVFIGLFALATGRGPRVAEALRERRSLRLLALSATAISTNWLMFIWSVQTGRALEASLGYYIFPLLAAGMGALWHGERFDRAQGAALGLAGAAVLTLTFGLGAAPWVSLGLALTFGIYGLAKKGLATGPISSVVAEVVLLAPLAAGWLAGAHLLGWTDFTGLPGGLFGQDVATSLMLMFSGILTGGPLILFSLGAQRLRYSTVGLITYLNPTLQLAVATLVFAEPVSLWHALALPMIWLGLAIYSWDGLRRERRGRRPIPRP